MSSLPSIAKDNTDRNRTSPFAFTGNKFEFRAVGSSQPVQMPNVFVNVAVAEALDDVADRLERRLKAKQDVVAAMLAVAAEVYAEDQAVVFNGDNYGEEWIREAARRGLPNLKDTPAALEIYLDADARRLLSERGVFDAHEMDARYVVKLETFVRQVEIEAAMLLRMVDTGVAPTAVKQQEALARAVAAAKSSGVDVPGQSKVLASYVADLELLLAKRAALASAIDAVKKAHPSPAVHARRLCDEVRPAMAALRQASDRLEAATDAALWPFPTYHQLLFQ